MSHKKKREQWCISWDNKIFRISFLQWFSYKKTNYLLNKLMRMKTHMIIQINIPFIILLTCVNVYKINIYVFFFCEVSNLIQLASFTIFLLFYFSSSHKFFVCIELQFNIIFIIIVLVPVDKTIWLIVDKQRSTIKTFFDLA